MKTFLFEKFSKKWQFADKIVGVAQTSPPIPLSDSGEGGQCLFSYG
jgi:hypothetical protein